MEACGVHNFLNKLKDNEKRMPVSHALVHKDCSFLFSLLDIKYEKNLNKL